MMNILLAAAVPRRREGGVAGNVYNLAAELRALGHFVDCLFLEDLLERRSLPQRFETLDLAWRIARRIRAAPSAYDVVNIHAPYGFLYGFARRLRWRSNCPPYVMTMHGLEERRIHAMRREAAKGRADYFRWKNRLWHRLYHMPAYRFSILTADCAIVLNREAWFTLQFKYGLESNRAWYIPNGVETRYFLTREYPSSPARRLLFVGTWIDHKGVYYLREGFIALAREFQDLRLTVAGCQVDAQTVRQSFPKDVRERVEALPFVPVAEMPAVYARHDAFVFPSLMEGMPLVLLEAMASGLPVVTTDSCGMGDIVEDGYNGVLIKPADTPGFISAARQIIESSEMRERLGRAAQETMRRYTWDRIARRVESVFSTAMQLPRRKGTAAGSEETE